MNVFEIISEPLLIHSGFIEKKFFKDKVAELLINVGLDPDHFNRYTHQFSGGQRQRIAIARALALNPEVIICDEAVSSLDVSIQTQIIKLLLELRKKHSLSYLFVAHDLPVIKDLADRVIVMKSGKIIEEGPSENLLNMPQSELTKKLVSACPRLPCV